MPDEDKIDPIEADEDLGEDGVPKEVEGEGEEEDDEEVES